MNLPPEGESDLVRLADLADAFVDLIAHRTTEREVAERLRPHVRPLG